MDPEKREVLIAVKAASIQRELDALAEALGLDPREQIVFTMSVQSFPRAVRSESMGVPIVDLPLEDFFTPAKAAAAQIKQSSTLTRAVRALRRKGFKTVGDILSLTERDLRRTPGFGDSHLVAIQAVLALHGLKIGA
ncbi:MAG: hypothetical protein HY482_02810 [Candidatus Wildermuthbacteria bacterium]|nr:hypothetical protein [Candidatus Wildermuthbacteria bacterium]